AAIALYPTPRARLVIAPAPVPASLTLITEQAEDHGAGYKIVALHARDGSLAWQRDVAVYHQYTVSGAALYILGDDERSGTNGVWALRTADGALLWHSSLGPIAPPEGSDNTGASNVPLGAPVVADGLVYVRVLMPHQGEQFSALRTTDGSFAWTKRLAPIVGVDGEQSFAAGDGVAVVGGMDSSLNAFDARTGALIWHFS